MGELMPIASIKHWESPALRKYKGRIVFRGDNARDQDGKMAVFQELLPLLYILLTPTFVMVVSLATKQPWPTPNRPTFRLT